MVNFRFKPIIKIGMIETTIPAPIKLWYLKGMPQSSYVEDLDIKEE